jgi:hypothetical protein
MTETSLEFLGSRLCENTKMPFLHSSNVEGIWGRREIFSDFYQRLKRVCPLSLGERQDNDAAGWQRIEYGTCGVWSVSRPS